MPLIKSASKTAFKKNVETEMKANPGKDNRAQNLAIAYSVQKRNKAKKKMAQGGPITVNEEPNMAPPAKKTKEGPSPDEFMAKKFAQGGPITVNEEEDMAPAKKHNDYNDPESDYMGKDWSYGSAPASKSDNERPPEEEYMAGHFAEGGMISPAERIMRRKRMMAEGGEVSLEDNSEEGGQSPYDKRNMEAVGEQYDDSQYGPQPTDSNEHGDTLSDEDKHVSDLVSKIRERMKTRRGF